MAKVKLRDSETSSDRLPMVCMACGKPAATHITKLFRWYPEWTGVLILLCVVPFWIVAAVLSKYMTVEVPVCERHRNYFLNRLIALSVVVALIFLPPIGVVIFAIAMSERGQEGNSIAAGFCSFGFCVMVGIVAIYVIQTRMIRAKEITDRTITLVRVDGDFVDAMNQLRRDVDFDERGRRRHRRDAEFEEVLPAEPPSDRRESYRDRREPDDPRIRPRRRDDD